MNPSPPTHRIVDWNSLDPRTRRRFIQSVEGSGNPVPVLMQHSSTGGAIAGWIFLALIAIGCAVGLALLSFAAVYDFHQGPGYLLGYALFFFLGAWSLLRAVRSGVVHGAVPFKRGRYVFPTDLVIATGSKLTIVPLSRLLKLDGVHRHVNGGYTGTDLTFVFEGYGRETFTVQGKQRAEEILEDLRRQRQRLAEAVHYGNMQAVAAMDVFFEQRAAWGGDSALGALGGDAFAQIAQQVGGAPIQPSRVSAAQSMEDPSTLAKKVSPFLERAALVSIVAVLGAPPFWFVRNIASDEAAFSEARSIDSTWMYQAYLTQGGRHEDDVRDRWLPDAAFAEAQRTGTVSALRDFVRAYPQSPRVPQARVTIHERFVQVRQDFLAQAATGDPRMPVFMGHLLDWLEAHDSPPVQVRFLAPSAQTLGLVDQNLDALGRLEGVTGGMAPVSPHFTPERSASRESRITQVLQQGFAPIFPSDVMQLTHTGRIDEAAQAQAITSAVFDVSYTVRPSGAVYTSDTSTRGFVGIIMDFHIQMRIPDSAEAWAVNTTVEPPEHFTVSNMNGFDPSGDEAYRDGLVYSVMADRAFDQLSNQLALSFFRPDSNAYVQAQAASAQQHRGAATPTAAGVPSLPNPNVPSPY